MVIMKKISKQYPLVKALDEVNFTINKGEIHSLLGENGAGKSTLMKVLYGLTAKDSGEIYFDGKKVDIKNTYDAINLGIGMVHQHFMLTPVLTVTENIVLGAEPRKGIFFDFNTAVKEVSQLIEKFGFKIDPLAKVSTLSVGEQQRVEILKALYRKAEILILDEPTAVLIPQETIQLFSILKELKNEGKSIILITHKLKETIAVADTISVLRQGKMILSNKSLGSVTEKELATEMVGREVSLGIKRRSKNIGDVVVSVSDLTYKKDEKNILESINFNIKEGEILGIAGVEGNGQTELIEVLTGLLQADSMKFKYKDRNIVGDSHDFIKSGVGHIPEDRLTRGLVANMKIEENIILGYHDSYTRNGLLDVERIKGSSKKLIDEYDIRTPSSDQLVSSLSGGNQQKVVIARVFSQNPDVIIISQPTRGVDVGSMEYIHNKILELRDEKKAILLISSDLEELRNLSDRLLVIYEGKIVADSETDAIDEMELGVLMNSGRV